MLTYVETYEIAKSQWLSIDSNNDGRVTAKDLAVVVARNLSRNGIEISAHIIEDVTRGVLANFYDQPYVDYHKTIQDLEPNDKTAKYATFPIQASPSEIFKEIVTELEFQTCMKIPEVDLQTTEKKPSSSLIMALKRFANVLTDAVGFSDKLTTEERNFLPTKDKLVIENGEHISDSHLTKNAKELMHKIAEAIPQQIPVISLKEGYPITLFFALGNDHNYDQTYNTATYLQELFGEPNNLPEVKDNHGVCLTLNYPAKAVKLLESAELRDEITSIVTRLGKDYSLYKDVELSAGEREHLEFRRESPFAGQKELYDDYTDKYDAAQPDPSASPSRS